MHWLRRNGYDEDATRHVVHHRKSAKLERIIAELLRVPAADIWPDRYDAHGQPLDRRRIRADRRQVGTTKTATVATIATKRRAA